MMTWPRPGAPYGTVLYVHDGDTPMMDVDLGLDTWRRNIGLRLAIGPKVWINARELSQPGGPEARDHLASILTPGSVWPLVTFSWDKYGDRVDGDILLPDGSSLSQLLVDRQWAASYDGTGTAPVPPWPRTIT